MATTDELLNLDPSIGQRASDVRFDVLDQSLTKIGEIQPLATQVPTIDQSTTRRVNRTLSSLELAPATVAELDPFGDRIQPWWVLENGATFPLGVFLVGALERHRFEWGAEGSVPLVDQTLILDQPTETTIGYPAGTPIRDALVQQFAAAGVPRFEIDSSIDAQIPNPISWPAGTTKRLDIVNQLAALAGAYAAYFDNSGTGRVRVVPDLANSTPTLVYDQGGRIIAGSMVESDDLLEAPNRYIVVESGHPTSNIVGVYDVPDDAPHSRANRGFVVATTITEQGLSTPADANARAAAAAAQAPGAFEWVQFSSPPDPRHDTHDPVLYLGRVYREQGWRLPLIEGSEMTHDLRRVYGVA